MSDAHSQAAAAPAKYYVLQYSYVPDMMSKRDPYRQSHLDTIKTWVRHQSGREAGQAQLCAYCVEPCRAAGNLSCFSFHLAGLQETDGKMVMAGALVDPLDGGILIFKDCTKEVCIRCLTR